MACMSGIKTCTMVTDCSISMRITARYHSVELLLWDVCAGSVRPLLHSQGVPHGVYYLLIVRLGTFGVCSSFAGSVFNIVMSNVAGPGRVTFLSKLAWCVAEVSHVISVVLFQADLQGSRVAPKRLAHRAALIFHRAALEVLENNRH